MLGQVLDEPTSYDWTICDPLIKTICDQMALPNTTADCVSDPCFSILRDFMHLSEVALCTFFPVAAMHEFGIEEPR